MPTPTETKVVLVEQTASENTISLMQQKIWDAIQAEEAGGWRSSGRLEWRNQNFNGVPKVFVMVHFMKSTYLTPGAGSGTNITIADAGSNYGTSKDIESVLSEIAGRLPKIAKLRLQATVNVTAAATTQTINFGAALPAKSVILGTWLETTTLFSGGAISACVVRIGDGTTDNKFSADVNVFTGGSTGVVAPASPPAWPLAYTSAITPTAKLTSTTANLSAATAGDVTSKLLYLDATDTKFNP
jgi:hypothetical protein